MIKVILGDKGSGKTKRLIDLTNDALKTEHGNIIFVDDDKRYMYDLRHEIRFVDASEYRGAYKCTAHEFIDFLKIFNEKDLTANRKALQHSLDVMSVVTKARQDIGLIFPDDENL